MQYQRRPLVPEDLHRNENARRDAARERALTSLFRTALCVARSGGLPREEQLPAAERLLAKSWPNDTTASYLVRAASSPGKPD